MEKIFSKEVLFKLYRGLRHFFGLMKVKNAPQQGLELKDGAKQRFYIFGVPNHGNLGDSAIAFAEEEFILAMYPDADILFIDETGYWNVRRFLCENVRPEDVLVLTGGGNMGDLYPYSEDCRSDVIKSFPDNKKIIFPQTIFFFDDIYGKYNKKKMQKLYNKDKNLYIFAREEYSFELMKEMFGEKAFLVPDIVLSAKRLLPPEAERKGALMCIRSDEESKLSSDDKSRLGEIVKVRFEEVTKTDTVVPYFNGTEESRVDLRNKLEQFTKAEFVITDRLHGMVFSAITGTPCVAMSNYNKKVAGLYKWISGLSYVKYVESIDEVESAMDEVINAQSNKDAVFEGLMKKYAPLEKVLES